MANLDKDLIITIATVETALLAIAFGLKVDHDTFEREQQLETTRAMEGATAPSVDYRILNNTQRAEAVSREFSHPLFVYSVERFLR